MKEDKNSSANVEHVNNFVFMAVVNSYLEKLQNRARVTRSTKKY